MGKYKKLVSNSLLFSIGSLGSKIILFFLVPLYTNILTTSEYGITDLITTSANLLMPFLTLSINDSILRFTIGKDYKNNEVLKNSLIVLIAGCCVLFVAYPIINVLDIFGEYTLFFVVFTVFFVFRSSFSVYLQGSERINIYVIDGILYTFLLAAFNIIFLLYFKHGLRGYLEALLLSTVCSIIFQLFFGGILKDIYNKKGFNKQLLIEMIRYSIPLIANAVSWWVLSSSDRYVLNILCGTDSVGIYAIAAKMPTLVTTFTSIISQAWLISSVKEYENGKDKKFFSNVFTLYFVFIALAASFVIMIIKPFMSIYVGREFVSAWRYVPCLLLAAASKAIAHYFMVFYKAEKKNISEIKITLLGAMINIILNFIFITQFEILGACIATLLAQSIITILAVVDTRKFFTFDLHIFPKLVSIIVLMIQMVLSTLNCIPMATSVVCFLILILINVKSIKSIACGILKRG